MCALLFSQCVDMLVKAMKDCLKAGRWESGRFALRFVADLVNCHVISAGSLLQLMDNFVDAALEEGVPQVRKPSPRLIIEAQILFVVKDVTSFEPVP